MRQLFIQGQAEPDRFQVGNVTIGGQDLPWDDGEVDVDLIEPTGVDRCMDQNDPGIDLPQPRLRGFPAMRRVVVHDPNSRAPDR